MIETIPNGSYIQYITYKPPFSVICSVGNAPFYGRMSIRFRPQTNLLEFGSFDTWLFSLVNERMTIEDLCRLVFDELTEALGDIPLSVEVRARTTVHAPATATIKRGEL